MHLLCAAFPDHHCCYNSSRGIQHASIEVADVIWKVLRGLPRLKPQLQPLRQYREAVAIVLQLQALLALKPWTLLCAKTATAIAAVDGLDGVVENRA